MGHRLRDDPTQGLISGSHRGKLDGMGAVGAASRDAFPLPVTCPSGFGLFRNLGGWAESVQLLWLLLNVQDNVGVC